MAPQKPSFKPPLHVSIWVLVVMITGICFLITCIFWFTANFTWYCVVNKVDTKSFTFVVALAIAAVLQLFRFLHILVDALLRYETAHTASSEILRRLRDLAGPILRRDEGGETKMSDLLLEMIREIVHRLKK